jgi:hypothetical protein
MHKTIGLGTRVRALRLLLATVVLAVPSNKVWGGTAESVGVPAEVTTSAAAAPANPLSSFDASTWPDLGGLDPAVLSLALKAAAHAVTLGDTPQPGTLSIIDFSRPSTEKRLWVYDLRTHELLFHELVAHGRGSGENLAASFSNTPESNRSSLGLFRTGEPYIGKHGYSLRLDGLERGINDRARARDIVIHGAEYVSAAVAKVQGRIGRSLGCPAVRPEIAPR